MSRPLVVHVPANETAHQIPLQGGTAVTLVNLSNYLGLTLCADDLFNDGTTWPLSPGLASPQVGNNTLWVKNLNTQDVSVLVYQGVLPVSNTGATPEPYTVLDETLGPQTVAAQILTTVNILPTSTFAIVTITVSGVSGAFTITSGTIRLQTSTYNILAHEFTATVLPFGSTLQVTVPIPPGIFDNIRVDIFGSTSLTAEVTLQIFETNANLTGSYIVENSAGAITNYALESGGHLAKLAGALVFSQAVPGDQIVFYLSDTVGNLPTGLLIGGITANNGSFYPIKVATDGTVSVNATFSSPPAVNATIVGPLSGGFVAVAVENTPSVIISSPLDGGGNVKVAVENTPSVTISGTPTVDAVITGPLDGGGNVKVAVENTPSVTISGTPTVDAVITGPLDGSGNVKVAVENTPSVTISGTPTVDAVITGPLDGSGNVKVAVENTPSVTISGTPTVDAVITGPLDGSGYVQVAVENTPSVTVSGVVNTSLAVPSNATVVAYVTTFLVKNAAGTLYGLSGHNSGVQQFIQVFDSAVAPTTGVTVPKVIIDVPANTSFSIDWGERGRAFATGIYLGCSSTGPVFTTGAANSCWFDAQYV